MQSTAWVAASAVVVALGAAAPARAEEEGTPFDQGRVGVNLYLGQQSSFGYSHLNVGGGIGYFVLDGLELSVFALHAFGSGPSMDEVSPEVRYVAQPLVGSWPILPYVAAFYNHWFLGDGVDDLDTVGARGGFLHLRGRFIVGIGIAYERVISTCVECNYVRPDVTLGVAF